MPDYIAPPGTLPPGSTVWAYLRDSGGDAQEQSVYQQQKEIEAYCKRFSLVLVQTFSDVAKSGGNVEKRESFLEMIDLSHKPGRRPCGLLLWNFARFGRDLADSSYYKAILRKNGLVIHSLTDPIPEGDYGRVIEIIIDITNEDKRRQTSRDVKRGLQAAFKEGYSFGKPPTGYLVEHCEYGKKRDGKPRQVGRWIPNPDLWEEVKLAWGLRAEGKRYKEIQAATYGRIFKTVNCWCTFFSNKAYLGIGVWGELEIPDHHPAAIDLETWLAVQQVQAKSHRPKAGLNHPRTQGNPSLLGGLAVCIHCGYHMVKGRTGNKNSRWECYFCNKKNIMGNEACENRMINGRNADKAVIDTVLEKVLTPDFMQDILRETRTVLTQTEELDREETRLKTQLENIKRIINNLVDTAERVGSQAVIEKLQKRESEKAALETALKLIKGKRNAAQVELSPEALLLALNAWREEIIKTNQALQAETDQANKANHIRALKSLLTRFVTKVELGYNRARIWYSYPVDALYGTNVPLSSGGTQPDSFQTTFKN